MGVTISENLHNHTDIKNLTTHEVAGWLLHVDTQAGEYYIKLKKADVLAMVKLMNTQEHPCTVQVNVHWWDGYDGLTVLSNKAVVTINGFK